MTIGSLILRGIAPRPTSQQLADMILSEERARARAFHRLDHATALEHEAELDRLYYVFHKEDEQ